jgi:ankyrin repeat protein
MVDYEQTLTNTLNGTFPLHYAVMKNDINGVNRSIAEAPTSVNELGRGYTPLMYAIQWRKDMRIIDALLGCKAINVNVKNNQGTALHFAVLDKNVEVVRKLLGFANIDLTIKNSEGEDGETALDLTKGAESYDKMQKIIDLIKKSSARNERNQQLAEGFQEELKF